MHGLLISNIPERQINTLRLAFVRETLGKALPEIAERQMVAEDISTVL